MINILEKPLIRTYQYNAFAESIVGTHKDYEDWEADNYVQILICEDMENSRNMIEYLASSIFGGCPLLNNRGDEKADILFSYTKFIEYLDSTLRQGHYLYTFVDEYYIPNRISYQKNHFEHDILLYGLEHENIIYLGYDALGNYEKGELSAEQFYKAMQIDNECLIRVSLNNISYQFNIQKFVFMLKQYVCAEDSRQNLDMYLDMSKYNHCFYDSKLNKSLKFGVDAYVQLEQLMLYYDETGAPYDWRILHLLYEHKQSFYKKIKYLINKNYLEDGKSFLVQYDEIVSKARLIEILGLKYQVTRARNVSKGIREKILELKNEEEILSGLLDALIRQNGLKKV